MPSKDAQELAKEVALRQLDPVMVLDMAELLAKAGNESPHRATQLAARVVALEIRNCIIGIRAAEVWYPESKSYFDRLRALADNLYPAKEETG